MKWPWVSRSLHDEVVAAKDDLIRRLDSSLRQMMDEDAWVARAKRVTKKLDELDDANDEPWKGS